MGSDWTMRELIIVCRAIEVIRSTFWNMGVIRTVQFWLILIQTVFQFSNEFCHRKTCEFISNFLFRHRFLLKTFNLYQEVYCNYRSGGSDECMSQSTEQEHT